MARHKRSNLPIVTAYDRLSSPDLLRSTPNGGFAWKCHYCGRYACDISVAERYLCRCHGGSTPKQRDLLLSYMELLKTGKEPKRPGRPLKHGRYCRLPGISVKALIADYRRNIAKEAIARKKHVALIVMEGERDLRRLRSSGA
jgi:hypothetical protein